MDERNIVKTFEDMIVWKKAHHLVLRIYKITGGYPADERFGLVSQMRRASVSVPANIAEGFRKRGIKDKTNFYNIAQASLDEVRYYLILSRDLGYTTEGNGLIEHVEEVARLLSGLRKSIRNRIEG